MAEPEKPSFQIPEQRNGASRNFWHLAAEATMLGWNLAVPIVGGVLLGRYLDDMWGQEFTWTLTLLLLGVLVAFNYLYTTYVEHAREGE
jgi:predicted F0F1-ATPase subunit